MSENKNIPDSVWILDNELQTINKFGVCYEMSVYNTKQNYFEGFTSTEYILKSKYDELNDELSDINTQLLKRSIELSEVNEKYTAILQENQELKRKLLKETYLRDIVDPHIQKKNG